MSDKPTTEPGQHGGGPKAPKPEPKKPPKPPRP